MTSLMSLNSLARGLRPTSPTRVARMGILHTA
jgi:hypothetical protein